MIKQRYITLSMIFLLSILNLSCSDSKPKANTEISNDSVYVVFSQTGVIPVFYNKVTTVKVLVSNNSNDDVSNLQFNYSAESAVSISGCSNIKAHSDCVLNVAIDFTSGELTQLNYLVDSQFTVNKQLITQNNWLQFKAVSNEDKLGVYVSGTYLNKHNKSTMYLYAGGHSSNYALSNTMFNDSAEAIINKDNIKSITSGEVLALFIDGSKLPSGNVTFTTDVEEADVKQRFQLSEAMSVVLNNNYDAILSFISSSSIVRVDDLESTVTHTLLNSGNVDALISYDYIESGLESSLSFGVMSTDGSLDYGTCYNSRLESHATCTVKLTIDASSKRTGVGKFNLRAAYVNAYTQESKDVLLERYVGWYKNIEQLGRVVLSSATQNLQVKIDTPSVVQVKIDNLNNRAVEVKDISLTSNISLISSAEWSNCSHIAANSSCLFNVTLQGDVNHLGSGLLIAKAIVDSGSGQYTAILSPIVITVKDNMKRLNSFNVYGATGDIDQNNNTIKIYYLSEWLFPSGHFATFSYDGNKVTINDVEQISGVTTNDYVARYGDPATGGGKPMEIVVQADDGSTRAYALIFDTDQIVFRPDAFKLVYTSDVSKVKSYHTNRGFVAIDPITGKFTGYDISGKPLRASNAQNLWYVTLQNDYNFVGYSNNGGNPVEMFSTRSTWGNGYEVVLWGSDFYIHNGGLSDPYVCDTWGTRRCIPGY